MKTNNIIYTLQNKIDRAHPVRVETVVTKGLYRFSILGINSRESSDARDRIYSALRSSGLLNLKSDNRKITVNLNNFYGQDYDHAYDLAIAVSCMLSIGKISIDEKLLVLGGLSIGGEIISSEKIFQAIYTAIEEKMSVIVCSVSDLDAITSETIYLVKKNNINFIVGDRLEDLVFNLLNNIHHVFPNQALITHTNTDLIEARPAKDIFSNEIVWLTYIAMCGGHDISFEVHDSVFIYDFISEIYTHKFLINSSQLLYMTHRYKLTDGEGLKYLKPYTCNIDNRSDKQQLLTDKHPKPDKVLGELDKSLFGCVLINKLDKIPQNILGLLSKQERGLVFGICSSCPCGVETTLFTSKTQKCSCVKRSIIRHQQHLQNNYHDFFTIWLKNSKPVPKLDAETVRYIHQEVDKVHRYQFERYLKEQGVDLEYSENVLNDYLNNNRDISYIIRVLTAEARELYDSISTTYNQNSLQRLLRLAQTLHDVESINKTFESTGSKQKSIAITKDTMLIALSYIPKKDF